jgi:hypothetical protein
VNTTSGGMFGMQGLSIYGAAKFGMFGLTRGLALEGAAHNIKVNALSPGAATNSFQHFYTILDPAILTGYNEHFPPELVSPAIAYLAHETCEITGGLLHVGGGDVSARLIGATAGIHNQKLTIEDVRDNLSTIFDPATVSIVTDPRNPAETGSNPVTSLLVAKPYQPG